MITCSRIFTILLSALFCLVPLGAAADKYTSDLKIDAIIEDCISGQIKDVDGMMVTGSSLADKHMDVYYSLSIPLKQNPGIQERIEAAVKHDGRCPVTEEVRRIPGKEFFTILRINPRQLADGKHGPNRYIIYSYKKGRPDVLLLFIETWMDLKPLKATLKIK